MVLKVILILNFNKEDLFCFNACLFEGFDAVSEVTTSIKDTLKRDGADAKSVMGSPTLGR